MSRQREQQCKDLEVGTQCSKSRVRWKMVGDGEREAWEGPGMGEIREGLINHGKDFGFYTE